MMKPLLTQPIDKTSQYKRVKNLISHQPVSTTAASKATMRSATVVSPKLTIGVSVSKPEIQCLFHKNLRQSNSQMIHSPTVIEPSMMKNESVSFRTPIDLSFSVIKRKHSYSTIKKRKQNLTKSTSNRTKMRSRQMPNGQLTSPKSKIFKESVLSTKYSQG